MNLSHQNNGILELPMQMQNVRSSLLYWRCMQLIFAWGFIKQRDARYIG